MRRYYLLLSPYRLTLGLKPLLQAALTHASGADNRLGSNERLEFLGDAILGAVVCELLFHQYPDYLELFDSYNDSVEVWEGRERRLRSAETACRETIEMHNSISDTLQTVLAEAGIETQ